MRREPTAAEKLLWDAISEDRLGVRFRRQHVIGDYIADFACLSRSLIVELDSGCHDYEEQRAYDDTRNEWLKGQGFTVIRFRNEELFNYLEYTLFRQFF